MKIIDETHKKRVHSNQISTIADFLEWVELEKGGVITVQDEDLAPHMLDGEEQTRLIFEYFGIDLDKYRKETRG